MGNTPDVRFKGFSDTWEQRKLGELGTLKNGMNFSKDAMGIGFPFVNLQDIFGKSVIDCRNLGKAEANQRQLEDYNLLKGDVLFVRSSVKLEGVGEAAVVLENIENTTYSGFIIRFRDEFGLDNNFKQFVFSIKEVRDQIISQATDSANKNISQSVLANLNVFVPEISEQRKIGIFLCWLENLIILHQRKCDEMSELKKYMLQKMFPKKDEKFPEIRFSGFTERWEWCKVTELGKIFIGLVTTMTEHYTDEGTLLIRNSDIKDGRFEFGENPIYLEESFAQANSSRRHQVGDVITVHTGDVGTSAVISENEVNSIGFATIVTRPYTKVIDSNYLCAFLNTDRHKKWAIGVSTGDGRTNYNLGDYYECVVPVPLLEEQKKIGKYFKNLNNLITLHQRKYDELKQLKKYMLQNMFPKKG